MIAAVRTHLRAADSAAARKVAMRQVIAGTSTSIDRLAVPAATDSKEIRMNTLELDAQLNALILARRTDEAFDPVLRRRRRRAGRTTKPERVRREPWKRGRAELEKGMESFHAQVLARRRQRRRRVLRVGVRRRSRRDGGDALRAGVQCVGGRTDAWYASGSITSSSTQPGPTG